RQTKPREKSLLAVDLRVQIEFGEGTRYDLAQLIFSILPAENICGDAERHLPADPPGKHQQSSTHGLECASCDGLEASYVHIVGIGAVGPVQRRGQVTDIGASHAGTTPRHPC